ncbi:MAG: hypothetical protein ABH849_01575 [Nanoarchaeota archaeon]
MGKNPSEMKLGEIINAMIVEKSALRSKLHAYHENGASTAGVLEDFHERYDPLIKALNIGNYRKPK